MQNTYCMYKGTLIVGAPFSDGYLGSPHYVITVGDGTGARFNIVVNSASTAPAAGGDDRVYSYIDLHFADPVCEALRGLAPGLHTDGFPKLDYWQDRSLLDIRRMRPVPYAAEDGTRFDINDQVSDILTIDVSTAGQMLPYDNGHQVQDRTFWPPSGPGDVTVYGFGFLFQPAGDGLHETHMNQGNPKSGGHARENGVFQDGAVIVERGGAFSAMFTAFQTQWLPTDARGFPVTGAKALPDFIGQG